MPILDLPAWPDDLVEQWRIWTKVYRVMLFPHDPSMRKKLEAYDTMMLLKNQESGGAGTPVRDALFFRLAGPEMFSPLALSENMTNRLSMAYIYASIAADILKYVLEKGREGSVTQAIAFLQQLYAKRSTADGHAMPTNSQTLRQAWATYAPVSHFWCASAATYSPFFLTDDLQSRTLTPGAGGRIWAESFLTFLPVAECLRQRGIAHFPSRGPRKPLLSPRETWVCHLPTPLPSIAIRL